MSLLILSATISCAGLGRVSPGLAPSAADTPANASYYLENNWLQLQNGRAEWQAAPGSALKSRVAIVGDTIRGNINYDGKKDALLFFAYDGGGSGTFIYLAAALLEEGEYYGTNGILLGDRIGPPAATVRNGLVIVEYLDRSHDEPMAAAPSILRTRFFMLQGSILQEVTPAAGETLYQGWLSIGHETRSFSPCNENGTLWLLGQAEPLADIIGTYRNTMIGFPPYTPVFVILAGRKTAPPAEGFGAAYKEAFSVSRLVHIRPEGNCRSDFIILDSPRPGATVSSPLAIKGRARGPWFFEGDFPVILLDAQGRRIAAGYATAQAEWMTENFVDYAGMINFTDSHAGQQGIIILKKNNPTGLTQFDDALKIPITFK